MNASEEEGEEAGFRKRENRTVRQANLVGNSGPQAPRLAQSQDALPCLRRGDCSCGRPQGADSWRLSALPPSCSWAASFLKRGGTFQCLPQRLNYVFGISYNIYIV